MSPAWTRDVEREPCRVLLIEDDASEAFLIGHFLKRASSFECSVADRLEKAIQLLRERSYDVAILDLGLPDCDGLATFDKVNRVDPSLPIIVLTGNESENLAIEAVRRGAQDYLVKGFASEHTIVRSLRYAVERKRLEEQVLQAQKMQAVGSLADGIAHEFNNLLQVVTGYTRYAIEGLEADSQRFQDLQQVLTAAERAATLTEQLMEFGRPHELHKERLDLQEHVQELAGMLRPLLGERIELQVNLDSFGEIVADGNHLQQALMNLCINARDAMPDGGTLEITSRVETIEPHSPAHVRLGISGGFHVISVSDTGIGMSNELIERIFDPFFSTKSPQDGTGLGLAVVYGIVQKHGGTIEVDSEPGRGTQFDLFFPVAETDGDTVTRESSIGDLATT